MFDQIATRENRLYLFMGLALNDLLLICGKNTHVSQTIL